MVRRLRRALGRGPPPLRPGRRGRGADRTPGRRAAARPAGRDRRRRRRPGRRRRPVGRPAWSRCSWSPRRSSGRSTSSPGTCPTCRPGSGAVIRLRQMLAAEPEPDGRSPAARRAPATSISRPALRLRRGHLRAARHRPRAPGRAHLRAGRTDRLRQVHAGRAAVARRRARAGHASCSAASTCSTSTCRSCARRSAWSPSAPRSWPARWRENITLFADLPARARRGRGRRTRPDRLGRGPARRAGHAARPGRHRRLSAGEEQLVAFARLLVRDVQVVVLDEATARMDPLTEARVVNAADRLLRGRTGVLVAHRLSTTARAEQVAVLDRGRIVQQGRRARARRRRRPVPPAAGGRRRDDDRGRRRTTSGADRVGRHGPTPRPAAEHPPRRHRPGPDARHRPRAAHPSGVGPGRGRTVPVSALTGAYGAITGFVWGRLVQDLQAGRAPGARSPSRSSSA